MNHDDKLLLKRGKKEKLVTYLDFITSWYSTALFS